jgi:hypothetical protein
MPARAEGAEVVVGLLTTVLLNTRTIGLSNRLKYNNFDSNDKQSSNNGQLATISIDPF